MIRLTRTLLFVLLLTAFLAPAAYASCGGNQALAAQRSSRDAADFGVNTSGGRWKVLAWTGMITGPNYSKGSHLTSALAAIALLLGLGMTVVGGSFKPSLVAFGICFLVVVWPKLHAKILLAALV